MKVQEYRDLISAVTVNLASCRSAVGDHERLIEAKRLYNSVQELINANCPRKALKDETQ